MRWENDGTVVTLAFDVVAATFRLHEVSDGVVAYELTDQSLTSGGEQGPRPATSHTADVRSRLRRA
jgi:hypothetical protein